MSTEQPASGPAKNRNKLLVAIGVAAVVLLAIIAIAVASQANRAGQEADAKASAQASAQASVSAMASASNSPQPTVDDQRAADATEASTVCERQLMDKHPTATILTGKTVSTYNPSDNSYETKGDYTDAPAGNPTAMQFVCSSNKQGGTSWNVFLKSDGQGSPAP